MKKNIIKMILDIIMIVILALLFNSHVAAISFHEIAGLGVFGLFIIHCLLNIKWIIGVSKRFFSKSLAIKVRIGYIVNLLLAVTFILVINSGIEISQVLFLEDSYDSVWRSIHHFSSAVSIILVGIHLGLHWSFVSVMFKKIVKIKDAIRKPIVIVLLFVVLFFGVYSTVTSTFTSWLVEPFVMSVKDETATKHDDATKTVETSPAIVFSTIAKFISIMGVFAALTYYIEKCLMCKKSQ